MVDFNLDDWRSRSGIVVLNSSCEHLAQSIVIWSILLESRVTLFPSSWRPNVHTCSH